MSASGPSGPLLLNYVMEDALVTFLVILIESHHNAGFCASGKTLLIFAFFLIYFSGLVILLLVYCTSNGTQFFVFKILHKSYFTLKVGMRIEIVNP